LQREVPLSGRKRARERIVVMKREPLDATRSLPLREEESRERLVVLKREHLDATRSLPLREEESKRKASCPEMRASRCN
jgi:hypothetical protein